MVVNFHLQGKGWNGSTTQGQTNWESLWKVITQSKDNDNRLQQNWGFETEELWDFKRVIEGSKKVHLAHNLCEVSSQFEYSNLL